jgi:hypothetical protein
VQNAFDELRRGRLQLLATVGTIEEARDAHEVNKKNAATAISKVEQAQAAMDEATEILLADGDMNDAGALAVEAVAALQDACTALRKGKKQCGS